MSRWFSCGWWREGATWHLRVGPLSVCGFTVDGRRFRAVYVCGRAVYDGFLRACRRGRV